MGDSIAISGPWGMNEYLGKGKFMIGRREVECKKLGMLAGGTGITPMLQVSFESGEGSGGERSENAW